MSPHQFCPCIHEDSHALMFEVTAATNTRVVDICRESKSNCDIQYVMLWCMT